MPVFNLGVDYKRCNMGGLMGLVKWVAGTLLIVAVGVFIIKRVAFLNNLVFGTA